MTQEALERIKSTGRNTPCPCGSGKKYKKCHLSSDADAEQAATRLAAEQAAAEAEAEAAETEEGDEETEETRAPRARNRGPLHTRGPGARFQTRGEGGGRKSKLPRRSNG